MLCRSFIVVTNVRQYFETVLQRENNLYAKLLRRNTAANQILETQSPRIWRFGIRMHFCLQQLARRLMVRA